MLRTPQKWRTQILRSLELQKVRREEVARFKRAYTGDYTLEGRKKLDENKDEMSVNFIYTYVETVRPTIVPGTPKAFVEALDEESEAGELYYQAVINHYIRTMGLKEDLKRNVDDWFYSWCAFLTEWEYQEELLFEEDGKTPKLEMDEETGEPVLDEETGEPMQSFRVLRDRPIAKRLDPWDVIFDPDSKTRKEDRWRAYRMIMTKQEFNRLPGVTKEMKKRIRGKQLPRDLVRQPSGQDANPNAAPTERNWVILWRIYDLENNMIYLLPDGNEIDFFVEEKEWPYEFSVGDDRFPITILEGKQDAENPYSFSGFKAFWNQIQERNKLRTMLQSNVRRNAPGWISKKGVMDEEQKQKFTNSKIGEVCETNGDPKNIVTKPLPELNQGFFAFDKIVGDDLNIVSSLNEFAAGGQLADTATEASILDQKASVRKGEAKAEFQDYCAIIFGKIGQLAQQFLTIPQAVKIRDPKSPKEFSWKNVTGEEIQGEFYLWVEPGNDDRKTENLYRQQTLKGAELMANNPWVSQKKLAKKLARVFDWEPEDILKTEEEFNAEQAAAAQAAAAEQAAKNKGSEKPPLDFASIKLETLPPEIQALVVKAAMDQNNVLSGGVGGGVPQGQPGVAPGSPASPSLAGPPPSEMVPSNDAVNQTIPVNESANMPPPTPVQPASEFQGG